MVEMSWSNISITFIAYFILLKGKKTVSINNSIIIYIIILQLSWEAEKLHVDQHGWQRGHSCVSFLDTDNYCTKSNPVSYFSSFS